MTGWMIVPTRMPFAKQHTTVPAPPLPGVGGHVLWFDADDDETYIYGEGPHVAQWGDKMTGNNATQATEVIRPHYQSDVLNLRDAVWFARAPGMYLTLTTPLDLSGGYTLLCVCIHSGINDTHIYTLGSSAAYTYPIKITQTADTGFVSATGLTGVANGPSASAPINSAHQFTVINTTNTAENDIRLDGVSILASHTGTAPADNTQIDQIGVTDGTNQRSDGHINEILLYKHSIHVPTAQEILNLEAYLKTKWATP